MSKARTRTPHGLKDVSMRSSLSLGGFDKPLRPHTPNAVLASLRATQIITLKPVLPAELLETIIDYLPVSDVLRCARASKRMQEMVYEDARWVQKLKAMGVWNEGEARQRYEDLMKRKLDSQRAKEPDGIGVSSPPSSHRRGHSRSITIFDVGLEEERYRKSLEQQQQQQQQQQHQQHQQQQQQQQLSAHRSTRHNSVADGFDDMTLSSSSRKRLSFDPKIALTALRRVRSIRGQARQEYGKIHGALAPFYYDLVASATSNSDSDFSDSLLFKTFPDPEQQARILADLRVFARADAVHGCEGRQNTLESSIGVFENSVLRKFEDAYHSKDTESMRRYAHVLVSLNGGAAGIDIFISNHPYMLRKDQLGNPLDCVDGVAFGHCDLNPSRRFFEKLAVALTEQSGLIDQVFPPSVDVLLPFTNRVCEDIISDYITTLLDEAHQRNVETYLKAFAGVFAQALRFAISIAPSKACAEDFHKKVVKGVIRCFEPHVKFYLNEELKFFESKAEDEVTAWEKQLSEQEARTESYFMSNVSRQAAKRDFLSSFKKVVMMPMNALPAFPSARQAQAQAQAQAAPVSDDNNITKDPPSRASTPIVNAPPTSERSSTPLAEAPTTELAAKTAIMNSRLEGIKSLFSIEVAINLIHYAKASIERAAILVRPDCQYADRTKEQCEAIFISMLSILGRRHIQTGFDKAVSHLSTYNPREVEQYRGQQNSDAKPVGVEPLVTFLELVNVGDLIQQMVDVFYVQELVTAQLTDRDDFLNPAVKEKKLFEQMLDERVAAGMSKGIDVLMNEVEYMCATLQQTNDFNPGVDGTSNGKVGASALMSGPGARGSMQLVDIGPTETAKRIVETVSSHTSMLVGSTDKNMLDVFNQEVGLRLFGVLCKHIKRQRISVDGAIKLISDINLYSAFITTLRQKPLLPYFSALRELSQIYLVDCAGPAAPSSPTTSSSSSNNTTSSGSANAVLTSAQRSARAKELATIIADTDRYRGIFGAEEVYEFAERRADWYSVKRDVERAMYGIGCLIM